MKDSLVVLGLLFFFFPNSIYTQDTQKADSLLAIYNDVKSDMPLKVKVLGEVYNVYLYSDRKKAKEYLATAKELSEKNDYKKGIAFCRFQKGVLFHLKGKPDSASYYYLEAIDFYQKINDKKMIAKARGNMASIAYFGGDFQKAREITETCLREDSINSYGYNIELLGKIHWAEGHFNLALEKNIIDLKVLRKEKKQRKNRKCIRIFRCYRIRTEKQEKAMEYHSRAIEIFSEINHKKSLGNSTLNLGIGHLNLKEYDKATKLIKQSILLFEEIENKKDKAVALNALGKTARRQGDLEKAVSYMEESLEIHQKVKSKFQKTETLKNLAITYLDFGYPNKALPYMDQAVTLANSMKSKL